MPLIEELPTEVERALRASSGDSENIIAALSADLTAEGNFGQEWLIVTESRVIVFAGGQMRSQIKLDTLRAASADPLIGGAALHVTVDGEPMELVRYTNTRQHDFGRVAKFLGDVAAYYKAIEDDGDKKEFPKLLDSDDDDKRCPNCNLLLREGTNVCPACLKKHKVIGRLICYFRPYWKEVTAISVLMVSATVFGLVPPYLTKPLVDEVLNPKDAARTVPERVTLLGYLVLTLLLARLFGQLVGIAQGWVLAGMGARLTHDLRSELFSHIQFLSLKFFDKRKTGGIVARIMHDTGSLQHALIDVAPFFIVNILTLIGISCVMFYFNWQLTLLVLIPIPITIFLSRIVWKRMMHVWRRFFYFRHRLNAIVNDSLSGIRVVKSFAQEDQEITRFSNHSNDVCKATYTAERVWQTFFPAMSFITGTGMLIVWYVGGKQVIGGDMQLGTLLMFASYLGTFYGPVQFLSRISDWLARSLTSAQQVFEVIDTQSEVREAEDAVAMPHIEGHVEFKNITFGYNKHEPVLKDVSIDVAPGEMIGLVGHSGAGKSTTINLICRLYDVDEGSIVIDGVDIRNIRQQDLRSQIGIVLQDTFLFNGTIAENVRYADPSASIEKVIEAARAANAHDFIVKKSDGYDTVVGERGELLSGGERQRIAIARAILHNPRILILDEATSSVDTDTEQQIQEAIARLIKGRTTFAIAHRLSTLRNADRLLVLKDGRVEELGTHDELLAREGEFHRLVNIQQETSKITAVAG